MTNTIFKFQTDKKNAVLLSFYSVLRRDRIAQLNMILTSKDFVEFCLNWGNPSFFVFFHIFVFVRKASAVGNRNGNITGIKHESNIIHCPALDQIYLEASQTKIKIIIYHSDWE